jgi:hypothetical protein
MNFAPNLAKLDAEKPAKKGAKGADKPATTAETPAQAA